MRGLPRRSLRPGPCPRDIICQTQPLAAEEAIPQLGAIS